MTIINYESDPRKRGRTAVKIVGATAPDVQEAINRVMRAAENMCGKSEFIGPSRIWPNTGRYFVALGYVEIAQ